MNSDSLSFSSEVSREGVSSLEEETIVELFPSEEEDYIRTLMERETKFGFAKDKSPPLDQRRRSEAIAWILRARELFGFRFQTAYLSIAYFDRFLSRRPINSGEMWMTKLLPVACLALAAKMEEPKIPLFSDFRFDGGDFGTKLIEKMELFVLSTLEWKLSSITPFSFLHYFIKMLSRFDQSSSLVTLLSTATPLIMATVKEMNLMEHKPSSIAAAATLVSLDQELTRKLLDSKMRSVSHYLQFEDVLSFYTKMSEIKICQEQHGLSAKQSEEASSVANSLSYDQKKRVHPMNCSFEYGVAGVYKRFR